MKQYKLVEITWMDIVESDNNWRTLDELEEFITNKKTSTVKQVGYLFEVDEDRVALINAYFPNDDLFGTCNIIPRGCIQNIVELIPKEKEIRLLEQNS